MLFNQIICVVSLKITNIHLARRTYSTH